MTEDTVVTQAVRKPREVDGVTILRGRGAMKWAKDNGWAPYLRSQDLLVQAWRHSSGTEVWRAGRMWRWNFGTTKTMTEAMQAAMRHGQDVAA